MSRKYRQRGYQDDDRDDRPARRGGPRPEREGPRGRGLGAPTGAVFRCARCGEGLAAGDGVAPDAACGRCDAPLHTCTHCAHFDTSEPAECRRHEEIPRRVPAKSKANECPLFAPRLAQEVGSPKAKPDSARSAFDDLFDL